jgi:hypothetical protein
LEPVDEEDFVWSPKRHKRFALKLSHIYGDTSITQQLVFRYKKPQQHGFQSLIIVKIGDALLLTICAVKYAGTCAEIYQY